MSILCCFVQEPYTCTSLKVHSFREQFIAQTHADYIAIFASKRPYKLNKYRRFESGHQVEQLLVV